MLSRLNRRAEALDGLCLQAWGHPTDYDVRQELLAALETVRSEQPEHAHPVIQELFKQVHDRSAELSRRIQSATHQEAVAHAIIHGVQDLRQALAALTQALANRKKAQPPAQ